MVEKTKVKVVGALDSRLLKLEFDIPKHMRNDSDFAIKKQMKRLIGEQRDIDFTGVSLTIVSEEVSE